MAAVFAVGVRLEGKIAAPFAVMDNHVDGLGPLAVDVEHRIGPRVVGHEVVLGPHDRPTGVLHRLDCSGCAVCVLPRVVLGPADVEHVEVEKRVSKVVVGRRQFGGPKPVVERAEQVGAVDMSKRLKPDSELGSDRPGDVGAAIVQRDLDLVKRREFVPVAPPLGDATSVDRAHGGVAIDCDIEPPRVQLRDVDGDLVHIWMVDMELLANTERAAVDRKRHPTFAADGPGIRARFVTVAPSRRDDRERRGALFDRDG